MTGCSLESRSVRGLPGRPAATIRRVARQLRDGVPADEAPPRRRRRSVRHMSRMSLPHDGGQRALALTDGLGGGAAVAGGVPGTTALGRVTVGGAGTGPDASRRVPEVSAAAVSVPLSSKQYTPGSTGMAR